MSEILFLYSGYIVLAQSLELYDICMTVRVYSVYDTVPYYQLILNNSLYIYSCLLGLA